MSIEKRRSAKSLILMIRFLGGPKHENLHKRENPNFFYNLSKIIHMVGDKITINPLSFS